MLKQKFSLLALLIALFQAPLYAQSRQPLIDIPGLIQAENYAESFDQSRSNVGGRYRSGNVDIQKTSDEKGGFNIGWIESGEWLEFPINVTAAGNYEAEVRVASLLGMGMFTLEIDGRTSGRAINVDSTGGWQNWKTLVLNMGHLSEGKKTLRLQIQSGGFNINWLEISQINGNSPKSSTSNAIQGSVLSAASSKNNAASQHSSRSAQANVNSVMLGKFNLKRDLFLAHFDSKPDSDDVHAQAALGTLLRDSRFAEVNYFALAGTVGQQDGRFIDATNVMSIAFPEHWASAEEDWDNALDIESTKAEATLSNGGHVWIMEAGQSDFSAALVKTIKENRPEVDTRTRIHIVQHSSWNENQSTPADLQYVKQNTDYIKIADGNDTSNGTPGFKTNSNANWHRVLSSPTVGPLWQTARSLALAAKSNGAIDRGGFDFSDAVEATWIFGFNNLYDVDEFFIHFL